MYLYLIKAKKSIALDFVIDRLTNSIQNTISGDGFPTEMAKFTTKDCKQITKKNGWSFSWKTELDNKANAVYKLYIVGNTDIIQGLMSIKKEDDHIFMNLLESAPFNIGKSKLYEGVAGNLVAFPCKLSFQYGFEGFVAFTAKTKLIHHYETTLGAYHFGGHRMIIPTRPAQKLVDKYF